MAGKRILGQKVYKYRDIKRILRQHGWTVLRQTGGHHIWANGERRLSLPVEWNGEFSNGMLRNVHNALKSS